MDRKKSKLEEDFFAKRPLDRQIEITLAKWKPIHKKFEHDFRWLTDPTQLKVDIKTLRRADRLLKRLAPWMRTDERVDTVTVQSLRYKALWQGKVIDYFADLGVDWVADWLAEFTQKGGRVPEAIIADCAEEIASTFKEYTGQCRWAKVGEIIAEHFGKEPTDPRLWIYGIVKRNRKRRAENLARKQAFLAKNEERPEDA